MIIITIRNRTIFLFFFLCQGTLSKLLGFVSIRLFDLCVFPTTGFLMSVPPCISWRRCSVHCPLDHSIVWGTFLTRTITAPPMLLIIFYFIMEIVVNLEMFFKNLNKRKRTWFKNTVIPGKF